MARQVFPFFAAFLLLFGMADDWLARRTAEPADDLLAAADNTYIPPAARPAGRARATADSPAAPCLPPAPGIPLLAGLTPLSAAAPAGRDLLYLFMSLRR